MSQVALNISEVTSVKVRKSKVKSDNLLKMPEVQPAIILEAGRVYNLAPSLVNVEEGYNVRSFENTDDIDLALAGSIAFRGMQTPLTVRQDEDGKLWLLAGHRRLASVYHLIATGQTGIHTDTVPVMLSAMALPGDRTQRDADLLVSNSFKGLKPLAQSEIVERLKLAGMSKKAIALAGGFSEKYAGDLLAMSGFHPTVKDWIHSGVITAQLSLELIARHDAANKADSPNMVGIVERAIADKVKTLGYGQKLKISPADVGMSKSQKRQPVAEPVGVLVSGPDVEPVESVEPVEPEKPTREGKLLRTSGAVILMEGKAWMTANHNDPKIAAKKAAWAMRILEEHAESCPK